ncbi:hypothetical protein LEP1GSC060_0327 [Leptospira weilii serovar Ranarum str. ICFT]|uniref:Uncharacterized protein n=1 Tax=Leptospira weilii serovar Ranarum str. ICFT TaxID=1218598 RepID=N1WCH7_9LEPT|nr:hypothetical protein [Leptospira weilii]EMY76650.1 hypothetical protein LEP1GSC060_0327 [Leptospira weilii serovar Ranarum str. ICFT]
MRQIHFLTEAEWKRRFPRETFEILFENSHPNESALKEFYDQLKIWAQERNVKYWIEFPDSLFETFEPAPSTFRSISRLSEFSGSSATPSKIFPAYVWGESIHFPYVSKKSTLSSKIARIEEKIELASDKKAKKKGNTSVFRLEFQISTSLDLEKILETTPEGFAERIVERQGRLFLVTPKLNGAQSLFAIHLLSDISEKIEFNFCKVTIDLSENREILPVWFSRSGAILSGIDFENSPVDTNGNLSSLEIAVSPWLSPSFLFLILDSSLLDAWENLEAFSPNPKTPNVFPRFGRNESWRDLTEHRFASRIARHAGEEESFFHSLLQKEYEAARKVLVSTLENRRKELEELEIPELLNRLQTIQNFSQTISFHKTGADDWKSMRTEITNSVLEKWKEKKELETNQIEPTSSASAWKILIEIWTGRKP